MEQRIIEILQKNFVGSVITVETDSAYDRISGKILRPGFEGEISIEAEPDLHGAPQEIGPRQPAHFAYLHINAVRI